MKIPSVTLVGAGCGPGLITVKGRAALRQAEVLVYDDLIDETLLGEVPENAEKIYVGKRSGRRSTRQEAINGLLIRKAGEGRRVVRLKGGDSFVFGRGGEECHALQKAGIPFSVIPGVSSAIAVPEHAGIPVTHRELSRSFTVLTGKTADGTGPDYKTLAAFKGTLVFLMGLHELPRIASGLMQNGMPPETPAAVISRGFSPDETRINGSLVTIAARAANASTPAVVVIGDTAAFDLRYRETTISAGDAVLSDDLSSVCDKPGGTRASCVVVTGTPRFIRHMEKSLTEIGANLIVLPTLRTESLGSAIPINLSDYSWLAFTSAAGVSLFFDTLQKRHQDIRSLAGQKFACIGPETAKALAQYDIYADLVPERFTSADLGQALAHAIHAAEIPGRGSAGSSPSRVSENSRFREPYVSPNPSQQNFSGRVLILRSANGTRKLPDILTRAGIPFDEVKLYRTVPCSFPLPLPPCDYLVFGSAGGVRAFAASDGFSGSPDNHPCTYVCIGGVTAEELQKHTTHSFITAEEATAEGIAKSIKADWCRIEESGKNQF